MGVVSPLGCDLVRFWDRLKSGVSGIRKIQGFDTTDFGVHIGGEVIELEMDKFVAPKEQRRMDKFSQYAMAAAKLAVQDSGLNFSAENGERIGTIIGSGVGGMETFQTQHTTVMTRGPGRVSPFTIPQMICNMAGGLIAIEFGLKGPNYSVVSACASGAHSIGEALRMIQLDEADVVVAGGTEAPVCVMGVSGFVAMRALSKREDDPTKASRPFDANRDGFVIAEGSGIMVIEEYEHARKRGARIYGELAGYGATCDAFHMTAPADDGDGAARAMKQAMKSAKATPGDIDYINAHGTSTELNDKLETMAIKTAFGETDARRVMISSTKSMMGHTLGAAGAIESIVCALVLRDGVVPPTINYETPDPDCDLDYVPNTARQAKVRVCLNNSLGFGGHNASLLFKQV
jgi:3-oxoacyl-[acyl-carrier-protein] synthase II